MLILIETKDVKELLHSNYYFQQADFYLTKRTTGPNLQLDPTHILTKRAS